MDVITDPCWDESQTMLLKGTPEQVISNLFRSWLHKIDITTVVDVRDEWLYNSFAVVDICAYENNCIMLWNYHLKKKKDMKPQLQAMATMIYDLLLCCCITRGPAIECVVDDLGISWCVRESIKGSGSVD